MMSRSIPGLERTVFGPASKSQPSARCVRMAPPKRSPPSRSITSRPAACSRNAAVNPMMPPPMTTITRHPRRCRRSQRQERPGHRAPHLVGQAVDEERIEAERGKADILDPGGANLVAIQEVQLEERFRMLGDERHRVKNDPLHLLRNEVLDHLVGVRL